VALPSHHISSHLIDQLFTGKIRLKLLARLLLNPSSQVYLRQLERDLNVSSNTVRLELNKLSEMKLISTVEAEESKIKKYIANTFHPLYSNLRSIILKHVGVDQLLEEVFYKLGELDEVFLTGDIAEGKETPFIDLVMVGEFNKEFLFQLVERAEKLSNKKIRIAVYSKKEFNSALLEGIQYVSIYKSEMVGGVSSK
jgi:predicted AAA+ superfamily ATPase